jgi:hypothetical protein
MNYFKISHDCGHDIKVIVANSKYEAVGFYILEAYKDGWIESLDKVETLSDDHKIEVSCIGFPVYKTVAELHREKEFWDAPQVICELVD